MGKAFFSRVLATLGVLFVVCYAAAVLPTPKGVHPLGDEMINFINNVIKPNWTAGRNFHPDIDMGYIKKLCGVLKGPEKFRLPVKKHSLEGLRIPKEFDSRKKWPHCPSIREIRDQGFCGSCWAISGTEAMTDRYCIASKGKQFYFSTEDLISCCCGGTGCNGGFPGDAWLYWVETGIVSGGPYNSSQGCQPYEIAPCEHSIVGKRPKCTEGPTPKCVKKCESSYKVPYSRDRHFGKNAYILGKNTSQIQAEILKHGPVQAKFSVYSDFLLYKSGVYHHVAGDMLGGHAIKIIGWGEENGVPYWTVANSWNYDWGDGGFFKIRRDSDECDIEDVINAGLPKL